MPKRLFDGPHRVDDARVDESEQRRELDRVRIKRCEMHLVQAAALGNVGKVGLAVVGGRVCCNCRQAYSITVHVSKDGW